MNLSHSQVTTMLCPDPLFDIFGITSQILMVQHFYNKLKRNLYYFYFFSMFQNKCIIYIYLDFDRLIYAYPSKVAFQTYLQTVVKLFQLARTTLRCSSSRLIPPFSISENTKQIKIMQCLNYHINVCAIQNINVELSIMTKL